ncbi:hypothetical protein [Akkermansia muciniphila]|uniref:hypothetical protein n=1 Tax=Akkermansia muciniphila TaxID=239935 RepID=UPI00211DBEE9|nr:hypothetical protein [Akkermansia muciniphila]
MRLGLKSVPGSVTTATISTLVPNTCSALLFPGALREKTGLARENGAYDGFVSRFSRINRHPVSNSGQFRIRCRIMPEFAADDGVHIFPAVQKSSEVDFCFPDKTPRHPAWFGNGVESTLKVVVPA